MKLKPWCPLDEEESTEGKTQRTKGIYILLEGMVYTFREMYVIRSNINVARRFVTTWKGGHYRLVAEIIILQLTRK